MASGRLAAVTPSPGVDTLLYQVPASKTASAVISVCNTNTGFAGVTISIENSSAVGIASTNCIEFDALVDSSTVLERGGLVLGDQQKLFCKSTISGTNFIVYGYEE